MLVPLAPASFDVVLAPVTMPDAEAAAAPEVEDLAPVNVAMFEEPPPEPVAAPAAPAPAAPPPRPVDAVADVDVPVPDEPAAEVVPEAPKKRSHATRKARPPRPSRKPCDAPPPEIIALDESTWAIERPLIDHYASHLKELMKLAAVYKHDGADGRPDGFRVRPRRCSVLEHGGLRRDDVVNDINGRRINNVFQAIGAYLALYKEPVLDVRITRNGKPLMLSYHLEGKKKKGKLDLSER